MTVIRQAESEGLNHYFIIFWTSFAEENFIFMTETFFILGLCISLPSWYLAHNRHSIYIYRVNELMNLSLPTAIQICLTFASSESISFVRSKHYGQKHIDEWHNHRQ